MNREKKSKMNTECVVKPPRTMVEPPLPPLCLRPVEKLLYDVY